MEGIILFIILGAAVFFAVRHIKRSITKEDGCQSCGHNKSECRSKTSD